MLLNFALDSIIFQCFPFAQNQYPKYTQHYVLCPELAQKHLQKKKAHHQPLSRYNPKLLYPKYKPAHCYPNVIHSSKHRLDSKRDFPSHQPVLAKSHYNSTGIRLEKISSLNLALKHFAPISQSFNSISLSSESLRRRAPPYLSIGIFSFFIGKIRPYSCS